MSNEILTYSELMKRGISPSTVKDFVTRHIGTAMYQTACRADRYDRQLNDTINDYIQKIFELTGEPITDFTASNNRIASNFFHRLNTQRNMYSLGNGIQFAGEGTDEKMGKQFDEAMMDAGYYALIHGVSFCFWNMDRLHVFPITEFAPIWDEYDGSLRAGIRFWQLDHDSPMTYVLYEEDGYSVYQEQDKKVRLTEEKRGYKQTIAKAPADQSATVIGEENYGVIPIVPCWGSKLGQSTLVGMQQSIDSYDLIRSGFANDLTDVSQCYWIIKNAGGMTDNDLERFRDRLKFMHIASIQNADDGAEAVPYTQEIPYQARKQYLDDIRAGIYEDFGGLDVHTIAAGSTNDHIDAAYQPMDEEAADYERQLTKCIVQLLKLNGIDDTPVFKRMRISNHKEQVEIIAMEAQWLDHETVLRKLPNISPDEVAEIMSRVDAEDYARFTEDKTPTEDEE